MLDEMKTSSAAKSSPSWCPQGDGDAQPLGRQKEVSAGDARQDPDSSGAVTERRLHEEDVGRRPLEDMPPRVDDEGFGRAAPLGFADRQEAREIVGDLGTGRVRRVCRPSRADQDDLDALLIGLCLGGLSGSTRMTRLGCSA